MKHTLNSEQGWNFDNSFARLPRTWFSRQDPVPVPAPRLLVFNRLLAQRLGLNPDLLEAEAGADIFSGNLIPDGAEPVAQAYAGHQFGYFTMLGDGRAILLGEQVAPDGSRFDIQLKGSGQTLFSRRGDGRAALGPMLREYIISEAMHALGIPTTRSLAVVATGERVFRETPLPGAILTRVAASHLRVGTFQYLAAQEDQKGIATLAEYTLRRHYPGLAGDQNPCLALLRAVVVSQAELVAKWLHVGFIHGVMNTDNMSLCGETIDYGPCAFMDVYDPATVFSSIDRDGRYAYGNQPHIAQWNLARFAETLLPHLHPDEKEATRCAEETIESFHETFRRAWLSGMRAKLGLFSAEEDDAKLFQDLLSLMHAQHADYTNTLRDLGRNTFPASSAILDPSFAAWHAQWQARLSRQTQPLEASRELIRSANPAVIPRNHRVEEALHAATTAGDISVLNRLLATLAAPFEEPVNVAYCMPPENAGRGYKTYCGT